MKIISSQLFVTGQNKPSTSTNKNQQEYIRNNNSSAATTKEKTIVQHSDIETFHAQQQKRTFKTLLNYSTEKALNRYTEFNNQERTEYTRSVFGFSEYA